MVTKEKKIVMKKIKKLKSRDLFLLTSFANLDIENRFVSKSHMKYEALLIDSSHLENENVQFSVDTIIDELMFDNYSIYLKLKDKLEKMEVFDYDEDDEDYNEEEFDLNLMAGGSKVVEEFIKLYENLMLKSKFEYANIRSVQKQLLTKELENQIQLENYEFCSEIKKRITLI